ncbi:MAG: DUF2442 domain-containing protein [Deltaproteobacteria bacterium]|nr:DUF2442 domain-containing protein [Deltaproteobacteria bacterium]MBI3057737.1 DUF2442 domain-containing protein [Deltaproteobacteria bacterium]
MNYVLSPSGYGIHWPELDEDLSIPAGDSSRKFKAGLVYPTYLSPIENMLSKSWRE